MFVYEASALAARTEPVLWIRVAGDVTELQQSVSAIIQKRHGTYDYVDIGAEFDDE